MVYSRTLSDEMDSILISSILETLEKTKDCERVRDTTIAYICRKCCDIFANSKMKKDNKMYVNKVREIYRRMDLWHDEELKYLNNYVK